MAHPQTTGCGDNLLRLVCLNWQGPEFGILSRSQKALAIGFP